MTASDAAVLTANKLTRAIKGQIPPPFAKTGIDLIKELTNIFEQTKVVPAKCEVVLQLQQKKKERYSLSKVHGHEKEVI